MLPMILAIALAEPTIARGLVYEDKNANGIREPGEHPLASVRVSNGRDVVETDRNGRYELPLDGDSIIFVIKPSGFSTPLGPLNLPKFHYVHKPDGSPLLQYPGVPPTGPLPESIDFPLTRADESGPVEVLVMGDPQPRNSGEVHYLAHDVLTELIDTDVAFAVALGDIAFDNLSTYDPYNKVMSTMGVPVHNVHGNHDMNFDVLTDELADETWERIFGPPTYSFDYGGVHFIAIDDVIYDGDKKYHAELGERHLEFIENDLAFVDPGTFVVLMMHIPLTEVRDRKRLYELLAPFEHTLSLAAHWHEQRHVFIGSEDGWLRDEPHHLIIHATACGAWWSGIKDEVGIPETTMRDGTPNGYSVLTIDGGDYSLRYKVARRPADDQMRIYAPDSVASAASGDTRVLVNVYAGSERSTVRMRVRGSAWTEMSRSIEPDPHYVSTKNRERGKIPEVGKRVMGRDLPDPKPSHHLWVADLPNNLEPGPYIIEVESTDMFGQVDVGRRILLVH